MTRLIDADALLENLENIDSEGGYDVESINYLITNAPTIPREGWVSVEDRMPNKVCLAFYKNELGNGRTVKAKYTEQYSEEANTDDDWVEYNEADDTYYYPAGWYEMIDNWDDFNFVTINHEVTHWQPLPAAPTGKE